MPVLKIDDIAPDGVRIVIDWGTFELGASMFIPCVDTEEAVKQLRKITSRKGIKFSHKAMIVNEKWGVRIWRTL